MSGTSGTDTHRSSRPWRALLVGLTVLCLMTACAQRADRSSSSRSYQPPGPPHDPWGPYIVQASGRFGVPDTWIREVMRRESAGRADATSGAGAMGLMQVMPGTYAELQARHGLGNDPYEPNSNILAGTAYLRQMYDRFGAPGFLAAYNAGPRRLENYLNNRQELPNETINYVAAIAPRLGPSTPMSGPLAVYADSGALFVDAAPAAFVNSVPAGGCMSDAAYDPDAAFDPSCGSATRTAMPAPRAAPQPTYALATVTRVCDPDEAFDPQVRCLPAPASAVQEVALAPPPIPRAEPVSGAWAVQVGAFSNAVTARLAAERARAVASALLRTAPVELRPTTSSGPAVLYRARLVGLSANAAADACAHLARSSLDCIVVRPEGGRAL